MTVENLLWANSEVLWAKKNASCLTPLPNIVQIKYCQYYSKKNPVIIHNCCFANFVHISASGIHFISLFLPANWHFRSSEVMFATKVVKNQLIMRLTAKVAQKSKTNKFLINTLESWKLNDNMIKATVLKDVKEGNSDDSSLTN